MDTSRMLTLSVQADQAHQFGDDASKRFDTDGGRIGRAEDCEWVLRAAGVSRLHAVVRYVNDTYFLEDRSSNGMLLNGEPLQKGHPTPLKSGDRLFVDTFEIGVDIASLGTATASRVDPQTTAPFVTDVSRSAAPIPDDLEPLIPESGHAVVAGGGLDPLAFLDAPPDVHALGAAVDDGWNHTPGSHDVFHPPRPAAQAPASVLPENWDLTGTRQAAAAVTPLPEPEPSPAPVAAPPPAPVPATPPVAAVPPPPPEPPYVAPAPVAPVALAPSTAPTDLQALFHVAIDGIIDVLRARTELKNTFRLPVTVIQRSENNPLKFAPDANEAVSKLLSPPNPAFLTGAAALGDAVDDIRHHQVAMLFGMRTAFHAMLERFDPVHFEPTAAPTGGLSAFRRKDSPWDAYRQQFQRLTANPDDCFQRLFGDVFAQAYEEQLARLKTPRQPGFA